MSYTYIYICLRIYTHTHTYIRKVCPPVSEERPTWSEAFVSKWTCGKAMRIEADKYGTTRHMVQRKIQKRKTYLNDEGVRKVIAHE